jgi:hypothetical protein
VGQRAARERAAGVGVTGHGARRGAAGARSQASARPPARRAGGSEIRSMEASPPPATALRRCGGRAAARHRFSAMAHSVVTAKATPGGTRRLPWTSPTGFRYGSATAERSRRPPGGAEASGGAPEVATQRARRSPGGCACVREGAGATQARRLAAGLASSTPRPPGYGRRGRGRALDGKWAGRAEGRCLGAGAIRPRRCATSLRARCVVVKPLAGYRT